MGAGQAELSSYGRLCPRKQMVPHAVGPLWQGPWEGSPSSKAWRPDAGSHECHASPPQPGVRKTRSCIVTARPPLSLKNSVRLSSARPRPMNRRERSGAAPPSASTCFASCSAQAGGQARARGHRCSVAAWDPGDAPAGQELCLAGAAKQVRPRGGPNGRGHGSMRCRNAARAASMRAAYRWHAPRLAQPAVAPLLHSLTAGEWPSRVADGLIMLTDSPTPSHQNPARCPGCMGSGRCPAAPGPQRQPPGLQR